MLDETPGKFNFPHFHWRILDSFPVMGSEETPVENCNQELHREVEVGNDAFDFCDDSVFIVVENVVKDGRYGVQNHQDLGLHCQVKVSLHAVDDVARDSDAEHQEEHGDSNFQSRGS